MKSGRSFARPFTLSLLLVFNFQLTTLCADTWRAYHKRLTGDFQIGSLFLQNKLSKSSMKIISLLLGENEALDSRLLLMISLLRFQLKPSELQEV